MSPARQAGGFGFDPLKVRGRLLGDPAGVLVAHSAAGRFEDCEPGDRGLSSAGRGGPA